LVPKAAENQVTVCQLFWAILLFLGEQSYIKIAAGSK